MTEQEAMSVVLRDGKRTCIYCDEYMNLPQDIGKYKYIILKDYCKQQGSKDVREWLIAKGLYLDIERDMREENAHIDWQASVEIFCAQILDVFPLAGEPVFPDEARTKLFRRAQEIFDTIVSGIAENEKKDLSDGECDVITIAIVQHIQRRDLQEGSESDTPFWSYIYSQFGFNPDNDPTNTQRIYGVFCRAVQKAFSRHHRFFSSGKETQKYYTSLMLHALMPAQSMESLFEILWFFYVKDLEFTYTPEDSIFKALVDCMATRWDKDIELQRELNLRSNALASGLKALFRERPAFMRVYCEKIVRHIDERVRGMDTRNPESTLDTLLSAWFARKEDELREQRGRASGAGSVRVAASAESIRLRYVLDNNRRVCISVPPIRLENKKDAYPWFELYQGENRIYADEMKVYGRLGWTTCAIELPLNETEIDYDAALNIEASIRYGGETLLERDSRLHRPFIVFSESGREVSAQSDVEGFHYLFAGEKAQIDTGTIDPEWLDCDGQLMRLYVDKESVVRIDGVELFLSRERQGSVRVYPSVSRMDGLRGRYEGEMFDIYPGPFSLDVRLPEGKRSLNYRVIMDDIIKPLINYCPDGVQSFVLPVPQTRVTRHRLQFVELTGQVTCSFSYAILPKARSAFESEIIYDDGKPTTVHVYFDGCDISSRDYPAEETDWVAVSTVQDYDLEARLPLVRGTLWNQSIFELEPLIWRGRISDASFVKLDCPEEWSGRLYLGMDAVPQNAVDDSYELGNFIRTHKNRDKVEELTLKLKNRRGQQDMRTLTRIAFEEYFTESPVSIEGDCLMWRPVGKYIGSDKDEFRLEVQKGEEIIPYALIVKNETVDRHFGRDFPCGEFPFRVVRESKSLFGKGPERVLHEGTLATGAPEQRRVKDKYLYLTRARCWDANTGKMVVLPMAETAGCLCALQFQGYSSPSGEELDYPEYIGELYFYNQSTRQWQYFNDREQEHYEHINPVHVWIINEQLIVLQQADGETLTIDRQYYSIVNRRLPKAMEKDRLMLPDYFGYRME